ncbi:cleft lip and palate associated transmembrane protein [Pluteus cervinus]|uniref:Cleft lip and palate associated transmembrane protein n=1 Tax=Pluteus cervinus TaxID=181527 RepID=A0ACD3AMW0_9AGAR|nr:cleft lip and palate associated transmembrane protein [Pluteus cervinus]
MSSAQNAAPPAAPAGQDGGQTQDPPYKKVISILQQIFMVWAISQLAGNFFKSKTAEPPVVPTSPATQPNGVPVSNADPWSLPPAAANLGWPLGQKVDMHIYLATSNIFVNWANGREAEEGLPYFTWDNIKFGDYGETRNFQAVLNFPKSVLNNGTLWAEIFLTRNGANPNPRHPSFNPKDVHHVRKLITPYLPKLKARKEKNLLSGAQEGETEEEAQVEIAPHYHPNITFALISDAVQLNLNQLPLPVAEHIHLIPEERDPTGKNAFYKPVIFANEFWHLREHYTELNSTTPTLPLKITFQPMSFMKFQIFASMTQGFREAAKQQGGAAASELDEVKRMFLETNPWFLGLTGFVSILHVVFEMLAFKSDVSHWRQKKEMVGVSVRIITNVFVQIVILLYLIDNNENTSWMILMGSGMGVVIEAWKITKAVDIRIIAAPPGSTLPYKLDIKDKHVLSEDEKKTQEYDKLAFRYVSYFALPSLAAYTIYSLVYESHKGWYSFVISTLTSYVYMFGFAQLVPQLIINYKLKSVAHMPMKAMVYKTLSTVVDDLFAFCIRMPFLHRLACFRDDVVFLIFLYQRWIYRIDPKRINEYGQVMAQDADLAADKSKGGKVESKKNR